MYHCVVHRRRRVLNIEDDKQHNDSVLLLMAAYKLFSILTIYRQFLAILHNWHGGLFTQKSESNGLTFKLLSNLDLSTRVVQNNVDRTHSL